MKKKLLALILALVMVLGMLPMSAMAADEAGDSENVLSSLEIAVGGNTIDSAVVQTLTPTFHGAVTEYSTPVLDYVSDKNSRFVLVKIEAPEGATVTAKCGNADEITLTNGEWGVLQEAGGYWWSPTYSGCLSTGAYNKVVITVSGEGAEDTVYTVTVPMQPDTSNRSLAWKTDLLDSVYYAKDDASAVLTVEAQYKNRPLENEDEICYQWYSNSVASTEGGTLIDGATSAFYCPEVSEVGTTYYYAVASCADLESITSKVISVTVTEKAAPQSITIVCDHPYTIPDDWGMALGGVKFVAKIGDTLNLKAVDENGEETPVTWLTNSMYGGTMDQETGVYTITGTSYSYVQVASLYDRSIKSEEKVIEVADYSINQWNKTPSATLSGDGQSFPKITTQGGLDTYTLWTYTFSSENIAELLTDLSAKVASLGFSAMRPGTIEVTMELDLNGDGQPDGYGHTDSAVMTINGIAIEDAGGNLTKTYLEIGQETTAPTVQLKAISSTADAVFTWSSADETIAAVDENGVVTAVGVGSVIISANDGTYTGGIKVVVTSADIPYFEHIDFVTTNAWGTDLSNATWKSTNFKSAVLEYTGLQMTKAAAGNLTLKETTVYDTTRYTAVAEYTDAFGNPASIPIHSGDKTILNDLPFDTNVIKIILTDKADAEKQTVYTFEITRPRDTDKAVAQSGLALNPVDRDPLDTLYNGKTGGFVFRADENGIWNNTTYVVTGNHYNYRTWAQDALEAFTLTVKGNSDYSHARYSIDGGETWIDLGQPTKSGKVTGEIRFPARETEEENPVVKVQIQFLDDATYAANIANGKDGFADSSPNTYNVWVEQLPAFDEDCDILTAITDGGDWYPTFDKDITNYRILIAKGDAVPTLTFTVSDGAFVKIDGTSVSSVDGVYTLPLGKNHTINVKSSGGNVEKNYSIGYSEKSDKPVPDKVVDFLSVNSQYINGNGGGYGVSPQQILTDSGLLSLGNFGGYVTVYYENALIDDPNNAYGVDFYIDGNAFVDSSTGTGLGSMEPGQVWVSEDGSTWYALAGSEHYEDGTLWDYSVTYTRTETGGTAWSDNYGNTDSSTHGRSFAWPNPKIYVMNDFASRDSFTLTGILIPCVDGTIAGTDSFNAFSKGARFGYVDALVNGTANPYLNNADYKNESSGFDLAWAVDAEGNPVDVSGMAFHYVKIVTASNLIAGSANEKSTEVGGVYRAEARAEAVGKTELPAGVTITGNGEDVEITFVPGQNVYCADLGSMKYVSLSVNGAAADDNIYVNNMYVTSGEATDGIKVIGEKLVRIIVQNGEKEPIICLLKLTSSASEDDELIEGVKLDVFGVDRVADTNDGVTYQATVGYRINEIGIKPIVSPETELWVNGTAMADSYPLQEGENTFEIKAVLNGAEQTVTLVVTREAIPVPDTTITVYFKLLGDAKHGDAGEETGVHTLRSGNLELWIQKTAYTVPDTYTVLDLITKALEEAGIDFVNEGGNYISEINGLGEFDNGNLSGWMYVLNGTHPGLGVAEQILENGDYVILHYTDDYTVEEGSEPWYPPVMPSEPGGSDELETGDEPAITVTVTIADKGSVVIAREEVAVTDIDKDGAYTVNDVLYAAHETAYKGGAEAGYGSAQGAYGLAITKLWGDDSAVCGYWLNNASCWSLTDVVKEGDYVVAFNYADASGWSDAYARFSQETYTAAVGAPVTLTLEKAGYDANWNTVFNPCAGADITLYNSTADYTVTDNGDGTYSVTFAKAGIYYVVASAADNSIVPAVTVVEVKPFNDVSGWAEEAILYVYEKGLMNGVGNGRFDPKGTLNRAALVTILYRLEGKPAVSSENPFTDIAEGQWYTEAVLWAAEKGIVEGYGNGKFGPKDDITRQQAVTILKRYSQYKGLNTAAEADLSVFEDAGKVSNWAVDAVKWAVSTGLMKGRSETVFAPTGNASRQEAATILMRYLENILK